MRKLLSGLGLVLMVAAAKADAEPNKLVPTSSSASAEAVVLDRDPCLGTCPAYSVKVTGDGHVTYEGRGWVDVEGIVSYDVPPADAAALFDRLRARDLWSMNDLYAAKIDDLPGTMITVAIGGRQKAIRNYGGTASGAPQAVSVSEADIDAVACSRDMVALSPDGIKRLQAVGFDFKSRDGGEMLYRAVSSRTPHDEKVLLALIDLGTPTTGGERVPMPRREGEAVAWPSTALLEAAIANHYGTIVSRLLAEWGAARQGKADVTDVYRQAVAAGDAHIVDRIRTYYPDVTP